MESNTHEELIENFSELTYRQRFAITEYGYLLSPEDAEAVGKMLGNFQERDVLPFCQANGKKVSEVQKTATNNDVEEKNFSQFFTVISKINYFLLFTAGLFSGAIGLIGMGTGDEGGKQGAMSFLFTYPFAFLLLYLYSKGLHKGGNTKYTFMIDILLIVLVVFWVIKSTNY